jgi:hypothetical protein
MKILTAVTANKDLLIPLISSWDIEDVKRGKIVITEDLLNDSYRDIILSKGAPYVKSYAFRIVGGGIFLDLAVRHDKIGDINLKYTMMIEELIFEKAAHRVRLRYTEQAQGDGGTMQSMMLKAAKAAGTLLKTLIGFSKGQAGLKVDNAYIDIDLDEMLSANGNASSIPENLVLSLDSCDAGRLVLKL